MGFLFMNELLADSSSDGVGAIWLLPSPCLNDYHFMSYRFSAVSYRFGDIISRKAILTKSKKKKQSATLFSSVSLALHGEDKFGWIRLVLLKKLQVYVVNDKLHAVDLLF